ncbi:hypothetical protein, partial [Roseburia sp. AF20-18LB]|uniref:hypothetical protein n=1 Tax=Roseburia sp. AF20-18LB TaxID=2293129 RepID=UPI001A9A5D65
QNIMSVSFCQQLFSFFKFLSPAATGVFCAVEFYNSTSFSGCQHPFFGFFTHFFQAVCGF